MKNKIALSVGSLLLGVAAPWIVFIPKKAEAQAPKMQSYWEQLDAGYYTQHGWDAPSLFTRCTPSGDRVYSTGKYGADSGASIAVVRNGCKQKDKK